MKQKQSTYPFVIMNIERVGEEGKHWRSFLDLDPLKQLFLFNSFGFTGFKEDFIKQDDQKIMNKTILWN